MRNFTRSEFACKCGCGLDDIDLTLVEILDKIREWYDKPMRVNSGCRCAIHNFKIGGAPRSQHVRCKAADVSISGIEPSLIAELAIQFGAKGVKVYNNFTHIDVRDGNPWVDI